MSTTETLKEVYERIAGKAYSPRQWRRIKKDYLKGKVDLITVKTHARLRKINGRKELTIADIDRLKGFDEFAKCLDGEVTGKDIYDAFRRLDPTPSPRTIRRWGSELGIPLVKEKWYTAKEAQIWIRFVGDRVRFKFPENALKKRGA